MACLPQAVVNKCILRGEYVLMLPFTRLVQSEMPFLAMGRTVPVQVEGVSPLVAGLCWRWRWVRRMCASGLGSVAHRWLLHRAR